MDLEDTETFPHVRKLVIAVAFRAWPVIDHAVAFHDRVGSPAAGQELAKPGDFEEPPVLLDHAHQNGAPESTARRTPSPQDDHNSRTNSSTVAVSHSPISGPCSWMNGPTASIAWSTAARS